MRASDICVKEIRKAKRLESVKKKKEETKFQRDTADYWT